MSKIMQLLMPDGSLRHAPPHVTKPRDEWTPEDHASDEELTEEIRRMAQKYGNHEFRDPGLIAQGDQADVEKAKAIEQERQDAEDFHWGEGKYARAPQNSQAIPAGVEIKRQCGFVEDHGSYGTKCWKAEGHSGPHQGAFVSLDDLPSALEHNPAQTSTQPAMDAEKELLSIGVPPSLIKRPEEPIQPSSTQVATLVSNALCVALAPLVADMASIARRFETFESNVHQLNLVAGELVTNGLTPIRRELELLRYNTGDKANSVVSSLEGLVNHLDKQLSIALKIGGQTEAQVRAYKSGHGLERHPSLQELTPVFDAEGNQIAGGVKANDIGPAPSPLEIETARLRGTSND